MFKPDSKTMDRDLRAIALVNFRVVLSYGSEPADTADAPAVPEPVVDADLSRMKWLLRSLAEMVNMRWWASEVTVGAAADGSRNYEWRFVDAEDAPAVYSAAYEALRDDIVAAANLVAAKASADAAGGAVLFDPSTKVLRKDFMEGIRKFVISALVELAASPGPRNRLVERIILEVAKDKKTDSTAIEACLDGDDGLWSRATRQYDNSFTLGKRAWYVAPRLRDDGGGLVDDETVSGLSVGPRERMILEKIHVVLSSNGISEFEENVIRDETGQKRVNFFAVVDACMRHDGEGDDSDALPFEVASLLAYAFMRSGVGQLRDFLLGFDTRLAQILDGDRDDSSVPVDLYQLVHQEEFRDAAEDLDGFAEEML